MKILILKPSSLGDVVLSLPVLRNLKRELPRSEIYWWLAADLVPVLAGDKDLAGIFRFNRRRWAQPRYWGEALASLRQMREQHFDWVIDLQGLARSGLCAWLANGALTIGVDDPREGATAFYDRVVRRASPETHVVDWYLEVVRCLGVPIRQDFEWLPPRPGAAEAVREKWRPEHSRWILIAPGARWPTKYWPAEHYRVLARLFLEAHPEFRAAIIGAADDREAGRQIARAVPGRCLDLTGQTSLLELIEWIRLGDFLVGSDSAPLHLAAAVGTSVVGIFGPTDPRYSGPYGQPGAVVQGWLPCVPCMRADCSYEKPFECLRSLAPETVWAAIERRLDRKQPMTKTSFAGSGG